MTALARIQPLPVIDPVEAFRARCKLAALRWAAGYRTLADAVDSLQAEADAGGLVAEVGQDAVQAIMAAAFGAVRQDTP